MLFQKHAPFETRACRNLRLQPPETRLHACRMVGDMLLCGVNTAGTSKVHKAKAQLGTGAMPKLCQKHHTGQVLPPRSMHFNFRPQTEQSLQQFTPIVTHACSSRQQALAVRPGVLVSGVASRDG